MPGEHVGRVGVEGQRALRTATLHHRHPQRRQRVARRRHHAQQAEHGGGADQRAAPRPLAAHERAQP
ncbi:MAG: hypothetical protein R2749_31440 [Acidimicrobiales bacterium]